MKMMGKCPKCKTEMYADVNGDSCCPECLRIEREPKKPAKIFSKKDKE